MTVRVVAVVPLALHRSGLCDDTSALPFLDYTDLPSPDFACLFPCVKPASQHVSLLISTSRLNLLHHRCQCRQIWPREGRAPCLVQHSFSFPFFSFKSQPQLLSFLATFLTKRQSHPSTYSAILRRRIHPPTPLRAVENTPIRTVPPTACACIMGRHIEDHAPTRPGNHLVAPRTA